MKKGVVLAILLLLAVPAVFAVSATGSTSQCKTRIDCYQLMQATPVACPQGYVRNYAPDCDAGKCEFCRPASGRIIIDCRLDSDCTTKTRCTAGLFSRCLGSKCICTSQAKPECVTNNDCTRKFLGNTRQKIFCLRSKCIASTPVITMLPWAARPLNYTTAMPRA